MTYYAIKMNRTLVDNRKAEWEAGLDKDHADYVAKRYGGEVHEVTQKRHRFISANGY